MSRRLAVLSAVGLLFALTLVMSAASLAQEGQGSSGSDLSPEQRERFIEGAGDVAGLSKDEITAALENPAAIEAIPVRVEESQDRPDELGSRSASAAECNTMGARRSYYNAKDQLLFFITGRKEWCFDFNSAVTYAPPATKGYAISAKGREAGWTFRGTAERVERFVTFRGFSRGGHVSRFVLRFKSCVPDEGCVFIYPQYRGVGYYNGIGYQKTNTVDNPSAND